MKFQTARADAAPGGSSQSGSPTRDFTVAVFVVSQDCVLLHFHPKLGMWLPPGGHIEPNELPDEAAVREVLEETGVAVRLVGCKGLPVDYPLQLIVPEAIQVEDISPGHQHIDLVYFAVPFSPLAPAAGDLMRRDRVGWYSREALAKLELTDEIAAWCERALQSPLVRNVETAPTDSHDN